MISVRIMRRSKSSWISTSTLRHGNFPAAPQSGIAQPHHPRAQEARRGRDQDRGEARADLDRCQRARTRRHLGSGAPRPESRRRRHHRNHALFLEIPAESIYDYFVDLGTSIDLPLIADNSPSYLDGIEFTGELTARLIQRLPNLVGMKEASFNSEKFFEILRAALPLRPTFAMIAGVEYLLPSVSLGGAGSYSSAGAICPNLCVELYESCATGRVSGARAAR